MRMIYLENNLLCSQAAIGLHIEIKPVGFRLVIEQCVLPGGILFRCVGARGPFTKFVCFEPVRGMP